MYVRMVMVRLIRGRSEEKGEKMSSHHLRLILTEKYLPVYSEIYNLMIYKYYTSKVCLSSLFPNPHLHGSTMMYSVHLPSLSPVCHVSLSLVCRSNTNFKESLRWRQIFNKIKDEAHRLDQHSFHWWKERDDRLNTIESLCDIIHFGKSQHLLLHTQKVCNISSIYLICIKNIYRKESGSEKGMKKNKSLKRRTN